VNLVDELLASIYADLPTVDCKRLCGDAYCGPILAFPAERDRMESAGWPVKFHITMPDPSDIKSLRCGYYEPSKQMCRVHAVRPLICRVFGAVQHGLMICPHGCQPSRWLTNDEVQRMLDRISALDGPPQMAPPTWVELR
jgi:Fe-S-cluster containining protein